MRPLYVPLLIARWTILFPFDEDKFILRFHKIHFPKLLLHLAADDFAEFTILLLSEICCWVIYAVIERKEAIRWQFSKFVDWFLGGLETPRTLRKIFWISETPRESRFSYASSHFHREISACDVSHPFRQRRTSHWHFPPLISLKLNHAAEIVFSSQFIHLKTFLSSSVFRAFRKSNFFVLPSNRKNFSPLVMFQLTDPMHGVSVNNLFITYLLISWQSGES